MNTTAIDQAMLLVSNPEDMASLCSSETLLPEGMTDLLKLCSSEKLIQDFAQKHDFIAKELSEGLFYFIEAIILNERNSNEKILGLNNSSPELQETHYQLLMEIYHTGTNKRPSSAHYSELITNAYSQLKVTEENLETISFSENRHIINQTGKNPRNQISNSKTVVAVILTVAIFSLVSFTGKFHSPSNPKLLVSQKNSVPLNNPQKLIKVSSTALNNNIRTQSNQITNSELQVLLKNLEMAYEEGNVGIIKPIIANSPEIKSQSTEQLNDKLETIFEITTERKMVLFNFNWNKTNNAYSGNGKFLSRYKLVGEEKWLTREGTALVSANNIDKELKITQFTLENSKID